MRYILGNSSVSAPVSLGQRRKCASSPRPFLPTCTRCVFRHVILNNVIRVVFFQLSCLLCATLVWCDYNFLKHGSSTDLVCHVSKSRKKQQQIQLIKSQWALIAFSFLQNLIQSNNRPSVRLTASNYHAQHISIAIQRGIAAGI